MFVLFVSYTDTNRLDATRPKGDPKNLMRKKTEAFFALMAILLIFTLPTFAQVEQNSEEEAAPPVQKYVELSIRGPLVETKPTFAFGPTGRTLKSLIARIDRIRKDDEVAGVLLKIESLGIGWAKLQEIRDKIIQLRGDGKVVIGYLQDGGNAEYMLACATDRIVLMPAGTLGVTGLRAEVMFFKGSFEKLDIEADMMAVGKYKSAIEPYTRDNMSDEQREAINDILDDLYEQQVQMITDGRNAIDETMANQLIDGGPFTAQEALDAKLVDALQYYDELVKSVESDQPDPIKVVSDSGKRSRQQPDLSNLTGFMKFFSMLTTPSRSRTRSGKPQIALIYATGPIMANMPTSLFSTQEVITPRKFTKALRHARDSRTIRAVVMRVDSPGGSAIASDLIWREVMLTQREKPVIISMSDVAGSGGYYIAMAAGTIVAEPGTITGSIGVLGGKLNLKGLYNKVGLTKEIVKRGNNATLYSDYGKFTPSERERVQKMLDTIYWDFVGKAAKGRHKTAEEIHELAQGRIWTGRQAKTIGLVDELGGLDTAFALAKKQIGLSADDQVNIIELPKPKTLFETLMADIDGGTNIQITPDLSIPVALAKTIPHFYWIRLFATERVVAALPFALIIR